MNLSNILTQSNHYLISISYTYLFILMPIILLKDTDIDVIITHNSIYDKICHVLSNCPAKKATVMFNFLSALIYAVDEEDIKIKNLTVYAKNMIRSSGCLATMCELFTSYMMHQDVWRSLCQCLAETCRGVEPNQSYCTHLIPMCIQRCSQSNIEVLLVLQSLLQNHTRNICLFIECNGISLFQREFLQHEVCLQLLNTLVQNSTQAVHILTGTDVCQYLRDFLHLYGPQSQLGQWATVILYHITGPKGSIEAPTSENEMYGKKPVEESMNKSLPVNPDLQCTTDTTRLFQNVVKEILEYNCTESKKNNRKPFNAFLHKKEASTAQQNLCYQQNNISGKLGRHNAKIKDLSFSFLKTSRVQPNFLYPNNKITRNVGEYSTKINNTSSAFLRTDKVQQNLHYQDNKVAQNVGRLYTKTNNSSTPLLNTGTAKQNFHYPDNKIFQMLSNKTNNLSSTFVQTCKTQQSFHHPESSVARNIGRCNTKTNNSSSSFLKTSSIQQNFCYPENKIARKIVRHSTKINNTPAAFLKTDKTQQNIRYMENEITRSMFKRKTNDLSFTFLQTYDNPSINISTRNVSSKIIGTSFQRASNLVQSHKRGNISHKILDESDFIPKFASTPKKYNKGHLERSNMQLTQKCRHSSISNSYVRRKIDLRIQKNRTCSRSSKTVSRLEQTTNIKKNNQRSISGWFFEAINESCTALVKTVKNIFKPRISFGCTNENFSNVVPEKDLSSCSYSFTNYMKKRDAILNNKSDKRTSDRYEDFSIELSNSCNTCNDTLALKHKLAHNEYLKQTVRKLKLGINLYGCDFKCILDKCLHPLNIFNNIHGTKVNIHEKISKQLWPHQAYMTPVVLYNLYRKIIIK